AESPELFGDTRLGEAFKERFLPTRFDAAGAALDRGGFPCRKLACPFCHLPIPRSYFETRPFFFSIAGAPFSGKSYFMTSAVWGLRRAFSEDFDLIFNDSDPDLNGRLIEFETSQFLRAPGEPIPKLQKTREFGDGSRSVLINHQATRYLQPFLFTAYAKEGANVDGAKGDAFTIALYDNAGESFLPAAGADDAAAPVTRHLGFSDALIFVFDPTQDARFLPARSNAERRRSPRGANENAAPAAKPDDPFAAAFGLSLAKENDQPRSEPPRVNSNVEQAPTARQELVFTEAIKRTRENLGIDYRTKYKKPLIVVLSKFDVWRDALPDFSARAPWARTMKRRPKFLVERVREISAAARELLKK
ncbi:MAG: hypothetical protein HUK22_03190, partial [Thermoguttaceae bacterium]|nr:hypothetical protein [Thermoguttaceae bacterium]